MEEKTTRFAELKYHSAFPQKQGCHNQVILVATNLTAFSTTKEVLCKHSSFFRGLFSLRQLSSSDAETQTPTLRLDETPESVIWILLTLLHREADVEWVAEMFAKDGHQLFLQSIQDLFIFADKHDFDNIPQLLAWRLPDLPFTLFALTAPSRKDLSLALGQAHCLVCIDPLKLPKDISIVCVIEHPTIVQGLFKLQLNRERWLHQLELLIKTEQVFENDSNDFARACNPGNGGTRKKACVTYIKFQGRFDRARHASGNAIMESLQQTLPECLGITERMRVVLRLHIKCPICSNRLIKMVGRCVSHLNKQGWSFEGDQDTIAHTPQIKPQNYLDWLETIVDVRHQISERSQDLLHHIGKLSVVPDTV